MPLVPPVNQERMDLRVDQERQVQVEIQDHRDLKEDKEQSEALEKVVSQDLQDQQDHKDHEEHWEIQEQQVSLDQEASEAFPEA